MSHVDPRLLAPCLITLACIAGCGSSSTGAPSGTAGGTTTTGSTSTTGTGGSAGSATDLTKLPIGDGKYTTSPKVGYIYSCQTSFTGGPGGASKDGPWIKSDGTFDFTTKVVVAGSVDWPTHAFSATVTGSTRQITGNALPSHPPAPTPSPPRTPRTSTTRTRTPSRRRP